MSATFEPSYPSAGKTFQPLFPVAPAPGFQRHLPCRPAETPSPPLVESRPAPEAILATAQARADELLLAAQAEGEKLARQVADQARTEQLQAFREASQSLLDSLRERCAAHQEWLAAQAMLLATDLVRRLVHERFEADPDAILPVIREALHKLADSRRVQIVIAPAHEEVVRQAQQELAAVLREEASLEITISPEAAPYGCVAHGEHGSVDARLETRLQAIENTVRETIAEQEAA